MFNVVWQYINYCIIGNDKVCTLDVWLGGNVEEQPVETKLSPLVYELISIHGNLTNQSYDQLLIILVLLI
jgi:hypothetical protein